MTGVDCSCERRVGPANEATVIGMRALLEQLLNGGKMALCCSRLERRAPIIQGSIHVGPSLQQSLHRNKLTRMGRNLEGGMNSPFKPFQRLEFLGFLCQ